MATIRFETHRRSIYSSRDKSKGFLTIVLALALLTGTVAVWAQVEPGSAGEAIAVPGLKALAAVEGVCPKEQPIRLDCNADGIADYVIAGSHTGELKDYKHPDVLASGIGGIAGGIAGAIQVGKVLGGNKNFRYAAVIDGKTLEVLWSFEAGALIAHSAISADAELLFLASHDDHVYAIDLASGEEVWRHHLVNNIFGLLASEHEVLAVTGGDVVNAYSPDTGTILWSQPVKVALTEPGFGVMLADADTVYLASLDNQLLALDRHSGDSRWVQATQGNPSLRQLTDGGLLVADKKALVLYDTNSGTIRWSFDAAARLHTRPVLDLGGAVGFHNGRSGRKAAILVVDIESGELRWSRSLQRTAIDKKRVIHVPEDYSPLKTGLGVQRDETGKATVVYVPDREGVNAIRAADGEVLWSSPAKNPQLVTLVGDSIFAADGAGVIHRLSPADGSSLWQYQTGNQVYQMEVLGGTLLVTLFSKDLLALSVEDGVLQARQPLGDPYRLVRDDDEVIVCGQAASWVIVAESP